MSIRNLDVLFHPRSVALIGASKRPGSVGSVLARNLFRAGFDGPIMPVSPKHTHIQSVPAYASIRALPVPPDLAVIATPPASVPGLIGELGAIGTKAAVVITAGFGEGGRREGLALQDTMLKAARPHLLRIVGPNCLGVMVPRLGLNAGFAGIEPRPGRLAFVAQSGAVVTAIVDWATERGIGFSHLVSLGDMSDVDFGDMLDYLANDREATAILLYIEAVTHARKFMSAARAAARSKPVIVVKAGRRPEGAKAAATHTGALSGSDEVYDAAIRRAGMLRVFSLEELFDAVETLAAIKPPRGDRLTILTNGGGIGVMAVDALIEAGGRLAELSDSTLAKLNAVLPETWSHANPIDIIGDADAERYAKALSTIFEEPSADAILVLNCPTAIVSSVDVARKVAETRGTRTEPPVLTSWVGSASVREARGILTRSAIPSYDTPSDAVRAFMHLVNYRRNQISLMETPPSLPEIFHPDQQRAADVIARALASERDWLTMTEVSEILTAYQIPTAGGAMAPDPAGAAAVAARLSVPVALKIVSPDIIHKSDVGGVVLDLEGPAAVETAAKAMGERIARSKPEARIEGFRVEPMIHMRESQELIVGIADDVLFGPTILFGQGGTAVEVIADKALALPPLNMHLAREMMARTRIFRILEGYRGQPPADLDAIALTLIKISQMVIDLPALAELDINPLLAGSDGVVALDARIKVAAGRAPAADHLAIRPYPKELEEKIEIKDGRTLLLRPVVPEDEPSLHAGFAKLTPEEIRLRFLMPLKTLSHVMAARFTQIDYDREMALILTDPGVPGKTEIYGVVRIFADPDNQRAEYAIIIRKDLTGQGLGRLLMQRILDHAQRRGIKEIFGDVLRDNTHMLHLCRDLGFNIAPSEVEPDLVRVSLAL